MKVSQDVTVPVGSIVRVVNTGQTYSNYVTMGAYMRLKNYPTVFGDNAYTEEGKLYEVVAKARHARDEYELLGLEDSNGKSFIIRIDGVEVVNLPAPTEDLRLELTIVRAKLWAAEQKLKSIAELIK